MIILKIKRYAIYYADLNPTVGSEISKTRPVVVVSLDAMNDHLDTVVVCPLTTKLRPKWRSRLQILCGDKVADIAVDQIRTISKQRLENEIDQLSEEESMCLRKLITDLYGR